MKVSLECKAVGKVMIGKEIRAVKDSREYVQNRISSIKAELSGNFQPPTFEDKSENFLRSLKEDKLGFVILSLDLVKSTILLTKLSPKEYSEIISVYLYEVSSVIPLFHGHVLKYTGDGIIAYFPEPSFISKNDLAIDCALTLRRLIYEGIDTVLADNNYPMIDIRIGLDSGEAYVLTIGSPKTKQHKDIIGDVVNLATKIQSIAEIGGINLGEITYRNLHTNWRLNCSKIELPDNWNYKKDNSELYSVYKYNINSG